MEMVLEFSSVPVDVQSWFYINHSLGPFICLLLIKFVVEYVLHTEGLRTVQAEIMCVRVRRMSLCNTYVLHLLQHVHFSGWCMVYLPAITL